MSNDVISQVRRYLDFAAAESAEEPLAAVPWVKRPVRWYQHGPAVAVLAGLLVFAVGLPALLFRSDTEPPVGSKLPDPLDVGVHHVWPDAGFPGSPDEIAAEFAQQALGWVDVETVSDPDATPDGPVWTTIRHTDNEDLDVLSIPIGDGLRVLMQVGSQGVTTGPADEGGGQYVGLASVAGAESAVLHIRFVQPDRVEVIRADEFHLEQGRVGVASDSPIGGVVIVYLDQNGDGLTAAGGHFGPFEAPLPPDEVEDQGLDLSEAMWVTHGPDGLRLDDGTLIRETQPFPAGIARDRQGGLVFTDSTGLWWFRNGAVDPELVTEGANEVIAVATTPAGPVALIWGAGPSSFILSDGTPADPPPDAPVEVSSQPPWLKWTAANGLSAWVTEPEVETDSEGQPSRVLEPAHLVIADGDEVLVDTRIADPDQAWARIHDFDGQRLIVSRGPHEPAMPEESFLLVDLATGEATEIFKAGGTTATFPGADADWNGPVLTPNLGS